MYSRSLLLAVLPIVSAHFQGIWPPSRGFSEDSAPKYPCGGFESANASRTSIPYNSPWPIQLNMEHTSVRGQINMALGNDPMGDDFTIALRQPFEEKGPQSFCIGGMTIPADLGITPGTNATIQIITNGDPNGGLYQCADVTFTDAALSSDEISQHCKNSTGVSAVFSSNTSPVNGSSASHTSSNGTSGSGGSSHGSGGSSSGSTSSSGGGGASSSIPGKSHAALRSVGKVMLGVAGLNGGLLVF